MTRVRGQRARVNDALEILARDVCTRTDQVACDRDRDADERRGVRKPACRVTPDEHGRARAARPEPCDPGERVEALLGPAIGQLIELHPVCGRYHDDERRERKREGGPDIDPRTFRDDELDREEKTAREHRDGDELEESATGVGRKGKARRVQRIDPTEQIRDLQGDEEHEERVDREECRRAGGGAQKAAKPRQDRGHRGVRPAAREKEDPSPDPGKGRGEQDACDELADRPFAEVE